MTYGINYQSPLNKIDGFHAASGQMPQDIMHVLFEGVLHMEIRLMLKCFIYEECFFALDTLNLRIENFAYGRTESRSKPSKPLLESHITGNGKLPLSGLEYISMCAWADPLEQAYSCRHILHVCMFIFVSLTN